MPLTAAQLAARAGKLTSSRVACLMTGDRSEILRLYNELIGAEPEEDLSGVWPVQLGATTEKLNLDWFERTQRAPVMRRGEVVNHPYLNWACCTLDGWCDALDCPVECKHVGGREPIEAVIERYQPQCQWIMETACADQCALSIIAGANAPVIEFIERDPAYAKEMIARGDRFINYHVAKRIPPVEIEPAPPPVEAGAIYDMTGRNEWAAQAGRWTDNIAAAGIAKDAEKILKAMVPDDAKKCAGHGVQITRDRAGRLSLRAQQ